MLPRAVVTGTITIDNTTLDVAGTGYHDHNWNVNGRAMFHFGWFWGKFSSQQYTATWSAILSTRLTLQPIMVVNKNHAGYVAIPPETIWFSPTNLHLDHFMFIPYLFDIEITTKTVFLVVSMEVIDVHYDRFMGFMSYWRYHVHCNGTFMVDGQPETVDGTFIAEYIRFR
jgi:predicted secreted hydrolase